MATTTDWSTIRDQIITKIKAISPTLLAGFQFDEVPRNQGLRDYAARVGSAALRRFELRLDDTEPDPIVLDPAAYERNESATLLVAYPRELALYGQADVDDMEKVIRSDAAQLRDTIFSPGNYVAGQSLARPRRRAIEKGDAVWFQSFLVELVYTEAQSLV